METTRKINCICSKCGEKEEIELPQIITEENRRETEDLSLFKWKCPKCGHILKLLYPCMYVNEKKKILIWYINDLKDTEQLERELPERFQQSTILFMKRFCHTLEEFGEKVRVLEGGLEDRTIELLKIMTFARMHISDETIEHIYFYRRNEMNNCEFTIFTREGPSGITLPFSMYEEINELVEREMPVLQDRFYCIDLDWAGEQIMQRKSEE